ncbi:MAG: polymer-forming cytoskeletal protein [Verrucomicrobiota bacterium]|nr:polymer-forming cytoskeletal protein [Verrucomicrobiota bacterium]
MAKSSPVKVSVDCPHCGFKQQEYAAAKSTMCRQCGSHYSPAVGKAPGAVVASRPRLDSSIAAEASNLLHKFDGFFKSNRSSTIECFECKRKQEVSGAATSTICPACSAHIDLRDYKVTSSFSRTIRTHGEVHVTAKGDLSSSTVRCRKAVIEGKLRGNLQCAETVVIDVQGKIPGRLVANEVIIEKRADVQFFRRVTVGKIEIRGRVTGDVTAAGAVLVRKHGSLDGAVAAKAISVERGGVFSGQLVIGKGELLQAELLPAEIAPVSAEPALSLAQALPAI